MELLVIFTDGGSALVIWRARFMAASCYLDDDIELPRRNRHGDQVLAYHALGGKKSIDMVN